MPTISSAELGAAINALGLTQEELAERLKMSQSQVSRVLAGKVTSRSKAYRRLCDFMRITREREKAVPAAQPPNADISAAVASVWDGTPAHAQAIAGVIYSLGALSALGRRNLHDE